LVNEKRGERREERLRTSTARNRSAHTTNKKRKKGAEGGTRK